MWNHQIFTSYLGEFHLNQIKTLNPTEYPSYFYPVLSDSKSLLVAIKTIKIVPSK